MPWSEVFTPEGVIIQLINKIEKEGINSSEFSSNIDKLQHILQILESTPLSLRDSIAELIQNWNQLHRIDDNLMSNIKQFNSLNSEIHQLDVANIKDPNNPLIQQELKEATDRIRRIEKEIDIETMQKKKLGSSLYNDLESIKQCLMMKK